MATYLIVIMVWLVPSVMVAYYYRALINIRAFIATLFILLALTTVFDNLIIHAKIVAYNADKLLGLFIGLAPIEDFGYTIVACLLVPIVWSIFNKKESRNV